RLSPDSRISFAVAVKVSHNRCVSEARESRRHKQRLTRREAVSGTRFQNCISRALASRGRNHVADVRVTVSVEVSDYRLQSRYVPTKEPRAPGAVLLRR